MGLAFFFFFPITLFAIFLFIVWSSESLRRWWWDVPDIPIFKFSIFLYFNMLTFRYFDDASILRYFDISIRGYISVV